MKLFVFPTARSLREYKDKLLSIDQFLPKLLTIDEFEKRAVIVKNKKSIDKDTRVIILRKATDFKDFKKLNIENEFFSFLNSSNYFFRFFEEISLEGVDIKTLQEKDIYAEYIEHLLILEQLKNRYIKELDKEGYFDKINLRDSYEINQEYLKNFETIEIFLEGFLTRFETDLFEKISKITKLIIHFKTNRYNKKMQERFKDLGFRLSNNKSYVLDFTNKEIKEENELIYDFDISYCSFTSRIMQIFYIKKKIYDFINDGIAPQDIAVILPDESFKSSLNLFDEINNLNFAMGFDFKDTKFYKSLQFFENFLKKERKLLKMFL